jgi:DNA-binding transcriptional LysR family regulator
LDARPALRRRFVARRGAGAGKARMVRHMDEYLSDPAALAIGCFASVCRDRLAGPLLALARAHPDVDVGVHEMRRPALLTALRLGELAVALLPGDPDPGFRSVPLWQDQALVVLPPGHPLCDAAAVPPAALGDLLFLVPREEHGHELHRFLARRLLGPDASLPGDTREGGLAQVLALVAEGRGAALLCESHHDLDRRDVVARPVAGPAARFAVHAHWRADAGDRVAALVAALAAEAS